ncbi:MAG TPA: squalene--hopene cyclase [Leptolyngbyaceae cyanobacterium M33_DOE_097]|uniref:Squalene--hopene cyclase n=1 Tax=Oscillatoriales cyanobacterium SpSt-418 TaxID=2282169 RepID=A0A7C3KB12_9CYAN|nr:squalene--hopene cyclase [Leptolyngbyaceae cyanobacterium M33_DOE_097]
MLTQNPVTQTSIKTAIARCQEYLLSLQKPEGYWWANLESNVTITAEGVLLYKIWGIEATIPLDKAKNYLLGEQRDHGGWELFYGDGGELSTSVEAYMALRLLGVSPDEPAMKRAKAFILAKGGVTKTRIFTKFHLALIGCYDWRGIPSIPPAIMLLPDQFPVNIYEMSSWARGSTVPLLIVFDQKPVYPMGISLNELYVEGTQQNYELPRKGDWTDVFIMLDSAFKLAEDWQLMPFREEGLKAAEKWVLERQEATGDWGGIIPAMLNSLLALRSLGYNVDDPIVERGFRAIANFSVETDEIFWVQPCVSPVWDTALVMRSLVDSGLEPDHPALVKGAEWLLDKQILDYGDWAVKNRKGAPGAWAFEFDNRFYPDVDDTAVVVMALKAVKTPFENRKQRAILRAVNWIASMQCTPGGWAAFDINNDQDWLNDIPYGDLRAMIDPNTADVTARVLEMAGRLGVDATVQETNLSQTAIDQAIAYLNREQEPEGCWFGRWGVNYVYGTSGVLSALSLVAAKTECKQIERGAAWLVSCQNADGGWGETCWSYNDPSLKGQGKSTASQTAWALTGLLAAGDATGEYALTAIRRGVDYLLSHQNPDGSWDELEFTGTGFPQHFYLNYNYYRLHFPLTALGRALQVLEQAGN